MTCLLQKSCCSTLRTATKLTRIIHTHLIVVQSGISLTSVSKFFLCISIFRQLFYSPVCYFLHMELALEERERGFIFLVLQHRYILKVSVHCTQKRHTPNTQSKKGENRVCSFGAAWLGIILKILLLLDIPIIPFSLSHFLVFQYFFTLFVSLLFFFFIFLKKQSISK